MSEKEKLEEIRDHIETTLEGWMDLNIRNHLEETLVRHLTSVSKLIVEYEKRHSRRWKWLVVGMGTSVVMNVGLMVIIFKLIQTSYM